MSSVSNPGNFLRVQRNFPPEIQPLTVELNKAYVDIANQVNNRTVAIFGANTQIITGESWFINGEAGKQQTLRAVYPFADPTTAITHNINLTGTTYFTKIYGTFFDGTVWWPLPYVSTTSATNQINISVSSTQILITKGAGSPPTISNGLIIVEWLSQI